MSETCAAGERCARSPGLMRACVILDTVTTFLAATDSVHTSAVVYAYLDGRAREGDAVVGVAVAPSGDPTADRDGAEALNVLRVRLATLDVRTERREGEPVEEVLAAADDHDADEVVVGQRGGEPAAGPGLGTTAAAVAGEADRPVVVVPAGVA